jgi:Cof subfamily protein (haloacid dehalogenase superfamily)
MSIAQRHLVALDLDGTLLTYESTLPAGHIRAVHELQRRGHVVVLATGRMVLTARWIYDALRLTSPMVAFNGGWVGTPGHTPFAVSALSAPETREILAELQPLDGVRTAYPDAHTWLMDREIPRTKGWRDIYRIDIKIGMAPFDHWQGPSHKVMFICEPDLLVQVAAHLKRRFAGRYQVVISQNDRLEVLPGPVTKAWGLSRLTQHLGIPQENVWAVGDADNDREMVAWAGHGCAMGQADLTLKRLARHQLPAMQARGLCALPQLMDRVIAAG